VLQYLVRYTHRIALSNRRILRVEQDQVALRCPDCGEGRLGVVAELDKHDAIPAHVAILDSS
jgi:hypothetical protein